jgi:hypothetical protein
MAGEVARTDPEEWTPAFARQRKPFAPGNQLAVKHGIYSLTMVQPIAEEFIETLRADPELAYLATRAFAAALQAWARAEARIALMEAYMDTMNMGEATRTDTSRTSVMEQMLNLEDRAERARGRLGLDPRSAQQIRKDFAQTKHADAATWLTQQRALAEAQQSNKPST